MSNPLNPNDPSTQAAQGSLPTQAAQGSTTAANIAANPFAKLFPFASPSEVKQMMNSFINGVINQMQQENNQVIQALQKLQQEEEGN